MSFTIRPADRMSCRHSDEARANRSQDRNPLGTDVRIRWIDKLNDVSGAASFIDEIDRRIHRYRVRRQIADVTNHCPLQFGEQHR